MRGPGLHFPWFPDLVHQRLLWAARVRVARGCSPWARRRMLEPFVRPFVTRQMGRFVVEPLRRHAEALSTH